MGRGAAGRRDRAAPSTAGEILRRCRITRLSRLERRERTVVRYEHAAPGELLHADVKKLGNIPAGGGWRFLGRAQGKANRIADGGRARSPPLQRADGSRLRPRRPRRPPG